MAIIVSGSSESGGVKVAQDLDVGKFVKKPLTKKVISVAARAELDRKEEAVTAWDQFETNPLFLNRLSAREPSCRWVSHTPKSCGTRITNSAFEEFEYNSVRTTLEPPDSAERFRCNSL